MKKSQSLENKNKQNSEELNKIKPNRGKHQTLNGRQSWYLHSLCLNKKLVPFSLIFYFKTKLYREKQLIQLKKKDSDEKLESK